MAGYIGSKSSVTQVDGYSEAEADAEFVTKTGDTMTGNLDITGTVTSDGLTSTGSGANTTYFTGGDNSVAGRQLTLSSEASGGQNNATHRLSVPSGYGSFAVSVNSTEAMRIDSSGNVGIGTSPSANLHLKSTTTGDPELRIEGSGTYNGIITFLGGGHANPAVGMRYISSGDSVGHLGFYANGSSSSTLSERMRIDSSGNLLVGTTTSTLYNATSGTGLSYRNGVALDIARENTGSGQPLINLNLTGADGDHLLFYKDGTNTGSIGSLGGELRIGTTSGSGLFFGQQRINPTFNGSFSDNSIDLGHPSRRFDDIYATNGTIQTSDFNEKQDIASLTATEMLVGKRISALFKTFRWKDSVAEKGDNARTHTGVIAQDVQAAFTAEGLDAGGYALFISSTWWEHDVDVPAVEAVDEVTDEDGNVTTEAVEAKDAYTRTDTYDTEAEAPEGATSKTRMGIRYPELLSFVAAYNEQRFASIEARLTALEA